ncbi:MAG TPA: 3-deoxy-7-phosphoheptulonate synthase, partial [Nitrosospira sp.]
MILVLSPDTRADSSEYRQLMVHLANLPGISTRVHSEVGIEQTLTEVYLIGNTKALPVEDMRSLPCVEQVVRISEEYRVL